MALRFIIMLGFAILSACNKGGIGNRSGGRPTLAEKTNAIMPGCYTHLIVRQLHFVESLGGNFPDEVPFNLAPAVEKLNAKSYNYVGEIAAKHTDNVVVILTLSEDLSQVKTEFRQWTQSPNSGILQTDGNVTVKVLPPIPSNSNSVDQAVASALEQIPDCEKLQN